MTSKLLLLGILTTRLCVLQAQTDDHTLIHKVAENENLYRISLKYGSSVKQIETLNPTLMNGKIKIGMKLKVPVPKDGMEVILPGPASPPRTVIVSTGKSGIDNVELPEQHKIWRGKVEEGKVGSSNNVNETELLLSKRSERVIKKSIQQDQSQTFVPQPEVVETLASSAEERKAELLNMAQTDRSIVVVTSLNTKHQYLSEENGAAESMPFLSKKVFNTATLVEHSKTNQFLLQDGKDNKYSTASLRKVLMAAERGEDIVVKLQIVMKDGTVVCVTDPDMQMQMVSELAQVHTR